MLDSEDFAKIVRHRQANIPPALDQSAECVRENEYAAGDKADSQQYANDMPIIKPFHFQIPCRIKTLR